MDNRTKQAMYEEFGKDFMDTLFADGFEDYFDEVEKLGGLEDEVSLEELRHISDKAYDNTQQGKVNRKMKSDLEELQELLNGLEDVMNEVDENKVDESIAEIARSMFLSNGTLPEGVWKTLYGAVSGEPRVEHGYAFCVVCNGTEITVIDEDGNDSYTIDARAPITSLIKSIATFFTDRTTED